MLNVLTRSGYYVVPSPLAQGHCVAVLMSLLEQMTPRHYQMFRQTFATAVDLEV